MAVTPQSASASLLGNYSPSIQANAAPIQSGPVQAGNSDISPYLSALTGNSIQNTSNSLGTTANYAQASNQVSKDYYGSLLQSQKDQQNLANLDPNNYKKIQANDGGYRYYNAMGQQINIQQYAQATGEDLDKVLTNSGNALDQQFLTDYATMKQVVAAVQNAANGNNTDLNKLKTQNSKLYSSVSSMTAPQIMQQFASYYPNYFNPQSGQVGDFRGNSPKNPQLPFGL